MAVCARPTSVNDNGYLLYLLHPLEDGSNSFTSTDAESCQTVSCLAFVQLPDYCCRQSAAAGTEGVPYGAGSTVDVDLGGVELERFNCNKRHKGKRLIDFEKVYFSDGDPGSGTRLFDRSNRRLGEMVRMAALRGSCDNARFRRQVVPFQPLGIRQKGQGGAVVYAGGVAGGDGAIFHEDRQQTWKLGTVTLEWPLVIAQRSFPPLPDLMKGTISSPNVPSETAAWANW